MQRARQYAAVTVILGRLATKPLYIKTASRKYLAIILVVKSKLSISLILLKNISGPGHPSLYRSLSSINLGFSKVFGRVTVSAQIP